MDGWGGKGQIRIGLDCKMRYHGERTFRRSGLAIIREWYFANLWDIGGLLLLALPCCFCALHVQNAILSECNVLKKENHSTMPIYLELKPKMTLKGLFGDNEIFRVFLFGEDVYWRNTG